MENLIRRADAFWPMLYYYIIYFYYKVFIIRYGVRCHIVLVPEMTVIFYQIY